MAQQSVGSTGGGLGPGFEDPEISLARQDNWNAHLARHAENKPDEPALTYGDRVQTWRQTRDRVEALADALHRRGVGPGDRVLVLMLNRPEYIESSLAITTVGAIVVTVNFRLTPAEMEYQATDCGAKAVITERALQPLAAAVSAKVPELSLVVVLDGDATGGAVDYDELIAESGEPHPPTPLTAETPAVIMYTSGTTGRPKGAVLSHGNLLSQCITVLRAAKERRDDNIAMAVPPMFHVAGLAGVAGNIFAGIPTVIYDAGSFDPGALLDQLAAEKVTSIFLVPAMWQAVCAEQLRQPRDVVLRTMSWGAAPATPALLRTMAETFPEAETVAAFGQTEMSPVTCLLLGEDAIRKIGSVGKPVPAISYRIVDPMMEDVPVGEVGEIVYRGPNMMLGYWNKPEETKKAFAGGWFHSGDLVREDEDGFLWVVDRSKDMIITGGENVYSAEVEAAVAEHDAIVDVAVYGRPDDRWGEAVVAAVVAKPDAPRPTVDELREFLGDKLARYKQPTVLRWLDELPRNTSGKVLKTSLRTSDGDQPA